MVDVDHCSLPSWATLVGRYENTAEHNDALHAELTAATWADPILSGHRAYVEKHKLGYGDAAFHAMWSAIIRHATSQFGDLNCLEIGVFKGQVISLWALVAREIGRSIKIDAVTPLLGNPLPRSSMLRRLCALFSPKFRNQMQNANFYANDDYRGAIGGLFAHFGLDFDQVAIHRGLSTDRDIVADLARRRFHVIYVDGDHTYEGALHDFKTFGPLVAPGGLLVADDASLAIPGSTFWKGHPGPSRAVETLPALGFRNILNVGHNRVYRKK